MAVIFPDIEPVIVSYLSGVFGEGVYVATKKAQPDNPQSYQVIVTGSYSRTNDKVLRDASAVIDVYADTYADASDLAVFVSAIIPEIVGSTIKKAEVVLGPVRQSDEAPQEKRSISVDFVVKGSTL